MSQLSSHVLNMSSQGGFVEGKTLASLTATERRVLSLIAEGHSQKEIAAALHRSIDTVRSHRKALGKKLGVANCVELARLAIENGLVSVDAPSALSPAPTHDASAGIANSSEVAIALVDEAGRCSSISPGLARIIGRDAAALTGHLNDLMQLDGGHQLTDLVKRAAEGSFVRSAAVVHHQGQAIVNACVNFLPCCPPTRRVYVLFTDVVPIPNASPAPATNG